MKKRDRDFTSLSFGASKGGDSHRSSGGGASGGSPFSLSRFLPLRSRRRHHSKSRMSLDSDSAKSESSLASHNVTSTSLPAFHNNVATTPLSRAAHHPATVAMATSTSGLAATTTTTTTASLPSSSLTLPFPGSPTISENTAAGDGAVRECPVCMTEQTLDCFPPVQTCDHRSCLQCLRHYLQIEISESRINIACPECNEQFHPNDIQLILDDPRIMSKYEDFMMRRVLAMDPDTRWCPAPDCGYAVIAAGCAGCPKLKCEREGCDTYFCYHCKQRWHPNQTCDAARAERSPNNRSSSLSYSHESNGQNEIKPCPRCGAFIVKMNDGSCNHMTCAVCAAEFCWLCMKEISDLHYLSPSGCTFWGRKPWSRKKKILWQLGTLVGAPVGITLVAGIAVPAMIIAIPVWVGRKIHARYRLSSKHRRNLAVTGGVAASILASPIIAGLAVGIGVPILLAYVYGVVPISLCRSGGCGVTTTNTGGVRFEFDEENEANAQGNFSGDNQSETMPAVANPSIAPSIGDASLGMTNSLSASGSHMDRVGVLRDADSDRDSASNRAIAGASLNGSLCGSTYTNKLEVQADVAPAGGPQKRASFSSESANISLSEKSATVSFDEASLRVFYTDGHREGDADSAGYDGNDTAAAAASPTTPGSPRHQDGRQGPKCKKLTRFVDDIQTVTPSSNVVVTGDTGAGCSYAQTGEVSTCHVSPRVAVYPVMSSSRSDKDRNTSAYRAKRPHNITAGKVSINNDVPLQTATVSTYRETDFPSSSSPVKNASAEKATVDNNDVAVSRVSICSEVASVRQVLPEVDTDKPVASRQSSNSPGVDSQSLGNRGRSLSLSCSSLDRKLSEGAGDISSVGMESEDSANGEPRSLRRHSYELAYRHGRISPGLFDEGH
ncbi:E3 ubiquitin-protein ligase RNF19B-like [Littorina saxatilis]|uniref:RBR-type E3 ubiquitin transferase n=1 Tax=Littorina saxatilis TaxID=31220 RepID=A0AAN9ARF5_9CAEN